MGAALSRRPPRLALVALAMLVVITATASACENEDLNRLMEEAPPPGAIVIESQQCTSGRLAAPTCATVWFRMNQLTLNDREGVVVEHATSIGWTFMGRQQPISNGSISLYFEKDGYKAGYNLLPRSVLDRLACKDPSSVRFSLCFDSLSIDAK